MKDARVQVVYTSSYGNQCIAVFPNEGKAKDFLKYFKGEIIQKGENK